MSGREEPTEPLRPALPEGPDRPSGIDAATAAAGREDPQPWPLVGLAVILALLIVATPSLLGLNTPGVQSPQTQPVLTLAVGPTGNGTTFLVEGIGQTTYARIDIGFGAPGVWPVPSTTAMIWSNWTNRTDALAASATTDGNPVAINVSVLFVDSTGASVTYVAVYAFNTTASTVFVQSLLPPIVLGTSSFLRSDLPVNLPLYDRGGSA